MSARSKGLQMRVRTSAAPSLALLGVEKTRLSLLDKQPMKE
jgi:hypothetical protein